MSERWSQNTPPVDEDRTTCAVCGFKGVNVDKMKFAEQTQTTYVTTGTVYDSSNVLLIDLVVTPVISSGSCPFCGTSRVFDGSAGDLSI